MYNLIIPGLYFHHDVNISFITLLKSHPELFYDNVNIRAVFGTFQFSQWDGGRIFDSYYHATKEKIERLRDIYNNELQVPMRFTFTNSIITEENCYSVFDNLVLNLCHNGKNEIVVNSPILEEYIRNNYPQYNFISSTTKCLTDVNKVIEELSSDKYIMVCLDYNLNKNLKFLETIPNDLRPKVEFLSNAICPPGCPNRKAHYYLNSTYGLTYGREYTMQSCGIKDNIITLLPHSNNLSIEDIKQYSENGFINFKLEGRTLPWMEVLLSLIQYSVKPEYQIWVIHYLVDKINNFNLDTYSYEEEAKIPIYGIEKIFDKNL